MSSKSGKDVPAIQLRHLSKKYPIYEKPSHKLRELVSLRRRQYHREFWALKDIDLEVWPGTTLGIVGANGSGKSTLLQIIAGILRQTKGDCVVNGSVAALLELGAGFNPEFTGRENVFMNGVICGMTRQQMEERFDDIVNFAEIGEFIDQPVKTYSSGMFVRLAFAVSIHVDPDILLVDEALAVGDMIFQHRCINRIRKLKQEGKTILFVTHDLQAVAQFCDKAILIDRGEKLEEGETEKVVQRYQALISEREYRTIGEAEDFLPPDQLADLPKIETIPHIHSRRGDRKAEVIGIILHSDDGQVVADVEAGRRYNLVVTVRFHEDIVHPIIGVTIRDRMGVELTSTNTSYEGLNLPPVKAGQVVSVNFAIEIPHFRPGSYSISPAVASGNIWEHTIQDWVDNAYIFSIKDTGLIYGLMKWTVTPSYRTFDD